MFDRPLPHLALCAALLLSGCRPHPHHAPEQPFPALATALLNHFYDTEPPCLWFAPIALPSQAAPDPKTLAQFRALAAAGVLAPGPDRQHFQLTPVGQAAFRPDTDHAGFGNLCFGLSRVQQIESTRPWHDDTFGDVTDVGYTVAITRVPPWARNPAVQQAFPLMALQLSHPLPHSATLKQTGGSWAVAIAPVDALPSTPPTR